MIDQEQQRDHAEEAAALAEQAAEQVSEQAHALVVTEVVRVLRALAVEAHTAAGATVTRLAEEVGLRQAPNVHRYELLARQQHTALLAASVASELESTGSYDLERVASGVADSHTATHLTDRTRIIADLPDRALLAASARVLDAVAEVLDAARQAETEYEVEQHEGDIVERDS